jgi:nucleotide-binding universal stress UspA family protein
MKTIKKILVPTDFSQNSKAAFEYALGLAEEINGSVKVVHIYSDYAPDMPLADPAFTAAAGQSITDIQESLDKFIAEEVAVVGTATVSKVKVETEICYGSPVQDLVEFSKSGDYDLIVMGTAGEKNWNELMFGSVSTHVSQQAHCPVLLIPSGSSFKSIKNIVYACDFDHKSFKHTGLISDTAKKFGADVHLFFVKTEENDRLDYAKDVEDMRKVFNDQAPSLNYTSHIVEEDDVVEGINHFGKDNAIDMVVAVTKHRNFLSRILHSSKTKELAIYSELPVLVIKADD